jgi:hypothetical protein
MQFSTYRNLGICFGTRAAYTSVVLTMVDWWDKRACGMKSSTEASGGGTAKGILPDAVNWVASSIFGLTGTVLLICWLLAYALEPEGWYARIGLMLALGAYGVDLVREKWAGWREDRKDQTVSAGTARAVKAA